MGRKIEMKTTYTVPEVPGSTRTSERPYTHAIVGRRDGRCTAAGVEARMATEEPKNRKWDAKHWDDCQRGSVAVEGQLYRNFNGCMVEARAAVIKIDADFIAANPDRAAYIEKMAAERADYLAKLKASEPGPLVVLRWSMSFKNAFNALGSEAAHHSSVRVVECVAVEKKAKATA